MDSGSSELKIAVVKRLINLATNTLTLGRVPPDVAMALIAAEISG
jgi:hypothetical protein